MQASEMAAVGKIIASLPAPVIRAPITVWNDGSESSPKPRQGIPAGKM